MPDEPDVREPFSILRHGLGLLATVVVSAFLGYRLAAQTDPREIAGHIVALFYVWFLSVVYFRSIR